MEAPDQLEYLRTAPIGSRARAAFARSITVELCGRDMEGSSLSARCDPTWATDLFNQLEELGDLGPLLGNKAAVLLLSASE
jgi:hypothetical protein